MYELRICANIRIGLIGIRKFVSFVIRTSSYILSLVISLGEKQRNKKMSKTLIFTILLISVIGCKTSISPAVKLSPDVELPRLPDSLTKQNGKQTVLKHQPAVLTETQIKELRDQYDRHQDVTNDLGVVSVDEYGCESDWTYGEDKRTLTYSCNKATKKSIDEYDCESDWTYVEDNGTLLYYCDKATKIE